MKTAGVTTALLFPICLAVLLTACGGGVGEPAVGKIAFESDRDGDSEIYLMNADGSGLTSLTDNSARDFAPACSPDGTRIAFVSTRDGDEEIYVMNADGSGQTNLTDNPAEDYHPVWSPDGTGPRALAPQDT